ncbi:MAG: NUDIX hydrolase [Thermomicrobiales bacterium]
MHREPPHTVTLGSSRGFDGVHLHLRVDEVRLPSGRISKREVVEHPGAVAIVPVTTDGHVVLIRQFHHSISRSLLGLPAGTREPGETAIDTARRELLEETGHETADLSLVASYFTSPGFTDERMEVFLATGCREVTGIADEDESIVIERVPLADIPGLVAPGADWIEEGKTLVGLLMLLRIAGDPPLLPFD